MTVDLLAPGAPNPVVFVLAWLLPLAGSPDALGITRSEDAPLPFRLVNQIYAVDDVDEGYSRAHISIHTFAGASGGVDADTVALREGDRTHQRMLYLARHPATEVTMPDSTVVGVDYLETIEQPAWRDYQDDSISRVKAVYEIGFAFVAV